MRKALKIVVVGLMLILVLGLATACSSSEPTVDGSSDTSSSGAEESAKQDFTNLAVGTVIDLDGVKISVDSITKGPKTYDGKKTVKATVTYQNASDESVSFNTYDWKVEDGNGVRVDGDAILDSNPETLGSGDLAPGGKKTGDVYFEDTGATMIVYVPSFWADDDQLIFWTVPAE